MPTQKAVMTHLKDWQEAQSFTAGTEAAAKAAREFNGLYEESAQNLLARTPDLFSLLTAYMAGKADGEAEEREKYVGQPTLEVSNG
jgi:hypothetical protein